MEGLEERVRRLEQRLRRMTFIGVTVACGVLAWAAWFLFRVPGEVVARRFVLEDAQGGRRGAWEPSTVVAGETDGEKQYAATTCFVMNSQKKAEATLRLCSPWESYGGPALSMRERMGGTLHVALDAYSLSILGRTSEVKGGRGALVLGVWQDKPSIWLSEKDGRRSQLAADGLKSYAAAGAVIEHSPSAVPRPR